MWTEQKSHLYQQENRVVFTLSRIHTIASHKYNSPNAPLTDHLSFCRLNDTLREKEQQVSKDLEEIEQVFRRISQLQDKLNALHEQLQSVHVYDEHIAQTEQLLITLNSQVHQAAEESKSLVAQTTALYQAKQNQLPNDIAQEFTALELLAERVQVTMETKEKDFKRAKTVRTEYVAGVDEIQRWLLQAEVQVQERSLTPTQMKELLQRINHEITAIYERFTLVKTNGQLIIENCRNSEEKTLVQTTIDQLAASLAQVRGWLDEKKQAVGDSLDAWTRFMNLYQIVMSWAAEKRTFIDQTIELRTLPEARNKLNDYVTAVKSVKPIVKHLSEMDKELEHIGQVTTVGDLKDKLQEAEDAKITVEAVLLERVKCLGSGDCNLGLRFLSVNRTGGSYLFLFYFQIHRTLCCKRPAKSGINVNARLRIYAPGTKRRSRAWTPRSSRRNRCAISSASARRPWPTLMCRKRN